jgi:NADH-quinone oxidoreductase subunit E
MLRGAYDIYERFQDELGIGHKGVTADKLFSLEEVECIGACCWAPAIQVNYDFHDELTAEHVAGILETYRGRAQSEMPVDGAASPVWNANGSVNHA